MKREDVIVVGNSSFYRPRVKGKDFAKLKKQFPKKRDDVLQALVVVLEEEAAEAKAKKDAEAAEKAKANEAKKADK